MAWIESHQTLREHPKVYYFMDLLEIEKPQAVGHLHLFWWWCVDYASDGQLKHNDLQIARAAEWSGDPKAFVEALIKANFLDRTNGVLTVHDWLEFCGALMERRIKRKEERYKRPPMVAERPPTNQTNHTKPTVPKDTFIAVWDLYPKKVGMKQAERHFNQTVKTEDDLVRIRSALENYLKSERVFKGFVQNGSTWFNNWQDWVDFKEDVCLRCKSTGKFISSTGYESICTCKKGMALSAKS